MKKKTDSYATVSSSFLRDKIVNLPLGQIAASIKKQYLKDYKEDITDKYFSHIMLLLEKVARDIEVDTSTIEVSSKEELLDFIRHGKTEQSGAAMSVHFRSEKEAEKFSEYKKEKDEALTIRSEVKLSS